MTPAALALVLVAAIAHATWNRLVHGTDDRLATMAVGGLAGGLLLLPATLARPPSGVWPLVGLSGLVEAAYAGLLVAAYARGSLAVAYPIGRGTAPLLVTLGSWLVLGQRPGPAALVGALALAGGLVLVARVGGRAGQWSAVGFAVATGAAIAGYSVIDALAVRGTSAPGYLGAALLVQGTALALVLVLARGRGAVARLRAALRPGTLVGVGVVAAYLLVLLAFQRADAGRVATLREVSVLIAVAWSGARRDLATWTGAALVVLGAALAAT
jgi:drug/metabolite transporter (DMT)-like permease